MEHKVSSTWGTLRRLFRLAVAPFEILYQRTQSYRGVTKVHNDLINIQIFTARKRSCGKVMFSLGVCLPMGEVGKCQVGYPHISDLGTFLLVTSGGNHRTLFKRVHLGTPQEWHLVVAETEARTVSKQSVCTILRNVDSNSFTGTLLGLKPLGHVNISNKMWNVFILTKTYLKLTI